jgi:PAS domain S-box-containing protein
MYEILLKSNPLPIFVYDEENLRFIEVNEAALSLYGYNREEFLQMDLTDLYSPEDIQTLLETSEETLKEGQFSKPFRHRRKNGSFIYVSISKIKFKYNDIKSVFNTIKDVTDSLEIEKKNQLYKAAFINSSDIIFVTDPTGLITYCNDAASVELGIHVKELINSYLSSLCEGEDRELLNSAVFQSHIKEQAVLSLQLKSRTGRIIDADLSATPILDINSEVESFSIVAKVKPNRAESFDKPKEIIREVIKEVFIEKPPASEQKAGQIDSSFLASVFHEILTPMNVILGFAQELTESNERLTPEQKEAVDIINQNRSSLLSIMNSIVEYSEINQKTSELAVEEIAVTDLIEPLDKGIKDLTGLSDVEFAYGKISSSLKFETDKKIFESVINNIIRMVSKITDQKKLYFSAYPSEEGTFNISISDNFARTSSALLDLLSKLFIEQKEPKEVGVSRLNFQMINSLLRILGGKFVVIKDQHGQKDCAFNFPVKYKAQPEVQIIEENVHIPELEVNEIALNQPEQIPEKEDIEIEEETIDSNAEPASTEVPAEIISEDELLYELQPEENIPGEEITIEETITLPKGDIFSNLSCLYIEDQIDSQILFKVQMKGLRDIQFAASFEEAVPLLETHKFDFIVMDINLQGEYNGLDALKVIHQMPGFENIPIIAVTAYVLPGDREKFIATGFNDFISKPIFKEKMFDSLKKIFTN